MLWRCAGFPDGMKVAVSEPRGRLESPQAPHDDRSTLRNERNSIPTAYTQFDESTMGPLTETVRRPGDTTMRYVTLIQSAQRSFTLLTAGRSARLVVSSVSR